LRVLSVIRERSIKRHIAIDNGGCGRDSLL
jgi:hypothetical protein